MMLKRIQEIQAEFHLPGVVIGVLRGAEPVFHTFGHLSDARETEVTPDTAYGIGSVSKVFTATLAMKLVADGKLDLHQPIIEYIPDLPLQDEHCRTHITMHHLLTHRGGFEGDGFIENGTDESALAEWVEGFGDKTQVTPAGAVWSYSNTGISLAGYVLARVSGMSYEDAMRHHVLTPLGLNRTGFGQPPAFENSSTGYEFASDGSREPRLITGSARSANPAGGLVSTVPDLLRFAAFHLGRPGFEEKSILPDDLRLSMQQPQTDINLLEKCGIGWGMKLEGDSTWTIEHGGWFNGFRAQLTLVPEMDAAFAILTTGPKGHEAIEHIQGIILEDELGIVATEDEALYEGDAPHMTGTFVQSHLTAEFTAVAATGELKMMLKTKWHGDENDAPILCPLKRVSENEYVVTEGEFIRSRITFIHQIPGTETGGVRVLNRICLPA